MRGHEPLIAMRRKRRAPAVVWIDTEPCRLRSWRDWPIVDAGHAHVWVEESDHVLRLDLRFVVGLTVHVEGQDRDRVIAVRQACVDAGAKRVLTMCGSERTDTEGHLQWLR